jgi:hypothetical protein
MQVCKNNLCIRECSHMILKISKVFRPGVYKIRRMQSRADESLVNDFARHKSDNVVCFNESDS